VGEEGSKSGCRQFGVVEMVTAYQTHKERAPRAVVRLHELVS
jgi:hypothetical protein